MRTTLEHLSSDDSPRLMITHTIESYWIQSQKKSKEDKVKVRDLKNSPKFQFFK